MSKSSQLEMAMSSVIEAGELLGIGSEMDGTMADIYDGVNTAIQNWAERTEEKWAEDAPWQTENLQESIASEVNDDELEAWVGVDVNRLLSVAGQVLPFKRTPNAFPRQQEMPDYDYTEIADEEAVSAGGASGHKHTPFIEEIWMVWAQRIKEEEFE